MTSHHHGQIFGCEEFRHEVDLLDADAVLPSHAAAQANAFVEDFVAGREDAFDLIRIALVE